MGKTTISWTDYSFNPVWGCQKVSPGCAHCYAERFAKRVGSKVWGPGSARRTFGRKYWGEPFAWNGIARRKGEIHRVFCGSMCDVFEDHPTTNTEREKLWPLIRSTPNLFWLLLTKRPENIAAALPRDWGGGYWNVWLGTSIENAGYAWRARELRAVPAVTRFISYEPALGPPDGLDLGGIAMLIYGGETGPGFRPDDPAWARSMRDKCRAAGVAFWFKQSSGLRPESCIELDGEVIHELPGGCVTP